MSWQCPPHQNYLRYLPQERKQVKINKNEELMLTPESNRVQLNTVQVVVRLGSGTIRRAMAEYQKATSGVEVIKSMQEQSDSSTQIQGQTKVVPLSTISLAHMQSDNTARNPLKESSHFQYIANKYSNIHRKPSPECQMLGQSAISTNRNVVNPNSQHYHKNNLKILDERARTNSYDRTYMPGNRAVKEPPLRKRVSHYQKNDLSITESKSAKSLTNVQTNGMQQMKQLYKKRN